MRLLPAALAITLVTPALAAGASGASLPGLAAADRYGFATGDVPTGLTDRSVAVSSGGILDVSARQIPGVAALVVTGNAPRNARITLTLLAALAPDLPTVLLQRADVQADVNGRFSAVVSLAPDHLEGSVVTLVATADGIAPVTTRLKIDAAL